MPQLNADLHFVMAALKELRVAQKAERLAAVAWSHRTYFSSAG